MLQPPGFSWSILPPRPYRRGLTDKPNSIEKYGKGMKNKRKHRSGLCMTPTKCAPKPACDAPAETRWIGLDRAAECRKILQSP